MKRVTNYNIDKISLEKTILFALILAFLLLLNVYGIIKVYNAPITETGFIQSNALRVFILAVLIFLILFILFGLLGIIVGIIKAKLIINKENRIIKKSNPYLYTRELPNNYGIGVTSLLFDSNIENYKDIVAVILDLCAKKYLSLTKEDNIYVIKVLKTDYSQLLNNEKYILNLVISKNIKNIDYKEWYNYCLQDGTNLNLYYHENTQTVDNESLLSKKEVKRFRKSQLIVSIIISLAVFIVGLTLGEISKVFVTSLLSFALVYLLLFVPLYLILGLKIIVNLFKNEKNNNFNMTINKNIVRTEKGVEELYKLISFKAFINDFGHFVDKNPEEVILWDRYLSYAQVFGLTKEIMKSGYKELIHNSAFQIDNIDNINLSNIEILQ